MAEEKTEGLEGLDDFGDDFGDQLDAFMDGENEEESDSELDSFFEDLSTIDDLEMKDEGGEVDADSGRDDTQVDLEGDPGIESPAEMTPPEETGIGAAAISDGPKEEEKTEKLNKEKKEKEPRKSIFFAASIVLRVDFFSSWLSCSATTKILM